jgi:hypothetical protein
MRFCNLDTRESLLCRLCSLGAAYLSSKVARYSRGRLDIVEQGSFSSVRNGLEMHIGVVYSPIVQGWHIGHPQKTSFVHNISHSCILGIAMSSVESSSAHSGGVLLPGLQDLG